MSIRVGGYGGFIVFQGDKGGSNRSRSVRMYYFHGSGGGSPVTKGVIQTNRRAASVDADIYWSGHIHEAWVHHDVAISPCLNTKRIVDRQVTHISTSTYKREWNARGGWHTERGAPMKPIGSMWLKFKYGRVTIDGERKYAMTYEVSPCLNEY